MCGRTAELPELKWMGHVANCWSITGSRNKQTTAASHQSWPTLYDVLFQFIINKKSCYLRNETRTSQHAAKFLLHCRTNDCFESWASIDRCADYFPTFETIYQHNNIENMVIATWGNIFNNVLTLQQSNFYNLAHLSHTQLLTIFPIQSHSRLPQLIKCSWHSLLIN